MSMHWSDPDTFLQAVAGTIVALERSATIRVEHLSEAIQYQSYSHDIFA